MSTIQNMFQQAQLAEAAYVNLTSAIGNQAALKQVLDVANGGSFSTAQAAAFAAEWTVVDQYNNSSWGGLVGTGFSATLFRNTTGQYSLAIRGSQQTLDELGITSINTAQTSIQQATGNGNNLIAEGSFVRNGQTQYVADIEFAYNAALTDANPLRPLGQTPVLDSDVYQLPWLRGYGDVASLHLACQNDAALKQAAQTLTTQSATGILQNFETFVAKWTGLAAANDRKGRMLA